MEHEASRSIGVSVAGARVAPRDQIARQAELVQTKLGSEAAALEYAVAGILASPNFLYRERHGHALGPYATVLVPAGRHSGWSAYRR
jgi:hypothetical protein